MPLTRAHVERVVIDQYREWLLRVGMDATTANGTNADLNGPLEAALDGREIAIADRSNIQDADLAGITTGRETQRTYADVKLATLDAILGHWAKVDYTSGHSQSLDQFGKRVMETRKMLAAEIAIQYGTPSDIRGGVAIGCMTRGLDEGAGGLYGCRPYAVCPSRGRWPGRLA